MKPRVITIFAAALLILLTGVGTVFAFIGPGSLGAGSGGGTLQLDASGNIGFGTASPTPTGNSGEANFGRIFTIASSSDPGISLKNLSAGGHSYTMYSRGNGRFALWDDTVGAVRLFIDPTGRVAIGATSTLGASLNSTLQVYGNISATNGIAGDIYPSSVIGGAFQATNYAFPSQLAVGTTTVGMLPARLYVTVGTATSTIAQFHTANNAPLNIIQSSIAGIAGQPQIESPSSGLIIKTANSGSPVRVIDTDSNNGYLIVGSLGINSRSTNVTFTQNWAPFNFVINMANPNNTAFSFTPPSNSINIVGLDVKSSATSTAGAIQRWIDRNGVVVNVVDSLGNVGIGTTTPQTDLSVVGTTTITTGNLKIATNGNGIVFPDGTVQTSASSGGFWTASSTFIFNNNSNGVAISNGSYPWANFGTGAAIAPMLDIVRSGNAYIRLISTDNAGASGVEFQGAGDRGSIYGTSGYNIYIEPNAQYGGNTGHIILKSKNGSGNVGIGTTTPITAKLVIAPDASPAIDVGGQKIVGLATPTGNNDAANKTYVDSIVAGAGYWAPGTGGNIYSSNAGFVGVGTTTPDSQLHVVGTSTVTGNLVVTGGITGTFTGTNSGATLASSVRGNGSVFGTSFDAAGTNYRFNDATNTVLLYVDATNGRVGVGTASPTDKLHVVGESIRIEDSYPKIRATANNFSILTSAINPRFVAGSGYMSLYGAAGTETIHLSGGNVGIGTTTPSQKVEVVGSIKMNGGSNPTSLFHNDLTGGADYPFLTVQPQSASGPSNLSIQSQRSLSLLAAAGAGGSLGTNVAGALTWDAFNRFGLTANGAYRTPLTITGTAGQVADIFDVGSNGGTAGNLFSVTGAGNVGIGTSTPATNLHVIGSSTISGNLDVGGNITGTFTGTNSGATLASSVLGATFGSSFQDGTNYRFNDATNTALLYIDAGNGRVGVGTSAPTAKFHVLTSNNNVFKFNDGASSATPNISIGGSSAKSMALMTGGVGSAFVYDSTGLFGIYSDTKANIDSGSSNGGTQRMVITASGNVGIGTSTPSRALTVAGNASFGANSFLNITDTAGGNGLLAFSAIGSIDSTGDFYFRNNPATLQYVTIRSGTGNVGIGTTTPSAKLEVYNGNITLDQGQLNIKRAQAQVPLVSLQDTTGNVTWNLENGRQAGSFDIYGAGGGPGQVFTINSTGKVGIGTTTPSVPLSVYKNGFAGYGAASFEALSGDSWITLKTNSANSVHVDMITPTYQWLLYNQPGAGFSVIDNTVGGYPRRLFIAETTGNVGLSTVTPSTARLVLSPGSQPSIDAGSQRIINVAVPTSNNDAANKTYVDSAILTATSSGVWTTNGANIYNSNSGNVGIGTTTPTLYKLQVAGTFGASNNLIYTDTLGNMSATSFVDQASPTYFLQPSGTVSLKTAGSVGIGMAGTPSYPLHVMGGAAAIEGTGTASLHLRGGPGASNWWTASGSADFLVTSQNSSMEPIRGYANGDVGLAGFGGGDSKLIVKRTTGNVGVGTLGPSAKLHVIDTNTDISPWSRNGTILLQTGTSTNDAWTGIQSNGSGSVNSGIAFVTYDQTNNYGRINFATRGPSGWDAAAMSIYDGNVGIGTQTPASPLSVVGTTTITGNLDVSGTITGTFTGTNSGATLASSVRGNGSVFGSAFDAGGTNYQFNTSSTTSTALLYIDAGNGRVGIGTGSPATKLHVDGTLRLGTATDFTEYDAAGGMRRFLQGGYELKVTNSTGGFIIYKNNAVTTPSIILGDSVGTIRADSLRSGGTNGNTYAPLSLVSTYYGISTVTSSLSMRTFNNAGSLIDKVSIFNGDTGRILLNPSGGNVGIGTSTPETTLQVQGTQSIVNATNPQLRISDSSQTVGTRKELLIYYNTAGDYGYVDAIHQGVSARPLVLNNSGGNVGIGTTTPTTARLVLIPGSQPSIDAGSQRIINVAVPTSDNDAANKTYVDSAILTATSSGVWTTNGTNIYNSNAGNVGVGTTTPTLYKLQVAGSLGVDNNLIFTDGGGNISATSYYDRASPAYFLQPSAAVSLKTAGSLMIGGSGAPLAKVDIQNGDSSLGTNNIAQIGLGYITGGYRHFLQTRHNSGAADNGNAMVLWLNTTSTAGGSSAPGTGNVKAFDFGVSDEIFYTAGAERMRINSDGNVGIGTNAPGANKLYVNGAALINGTLNMNGNNISSVGKLTVTTVDPLYDIDGKKYATYAASIAGGVKEEYIGRGKLADTRMTNDKCQKSNDSECFDIGNLKLVIDLAAEPQGSDLWVWYHAVDFSNDNVEVFATPSGGKASIWYEIEGTKIIFNGDASVNFSYRLVGKRHDWKDWPTFAKNQNEPASFTLRSGASGE